MLGPRNAREGNRAVVADDTATIRSEITDRFGYDRTRTVDEIRPAYGFDESCHRTVPEAIVIVLDPSSYEDTIRRG
jgi:ADP-ribosylglycohydrolase